MPSMSVLADAVVAQMTLMDMQDSLGLLRDSVRLSLGERIDNPSLVLWTTLLRQTVGEDEDAQDALLCIASRFARNQLLLWHDDPRSLLTRLLAEEWQLWFETAVDCARAYRPNVLWRYTGKIPDQADVDLLREMRDRVPCVMAIIHSKGWLLSNAIAAVEAVSGLARSETGTRFVDFWSWVAARTRKQASVGGMKDGDLLCCKALRRLKWALAVAREGGHHLGDELVRRIRQGTQDLAGLASGEAARMEVDFRVNGARGRSTSCESGVFPTVMASIELG